VGSGVGPERQAGGRQRQDATQQPEHEAVAVVVVTTGSARQDDDGDLAGGAGQVQTDLMLDAGRKQRVLVEPALLEIPPNEPQSPIMRRWGQPQLRR
jgi:hypothetical protein